MTDRELMQMALNDLSCLVGYAKRAGRGSNIDWASVAQDIGEDAKKTIKALRDRLAQPEPKCPPCNGDCNQGRNCPARKITIEAA